MLNLMYKNDRMCKLSDNHFKKKFLIVEDDQSVRDVLTSMLRSVIGEIDEIYTAESGEKAVELAKRMTFYGVLTDMQMPGMDGLDTFRELKKINPTTTIVIMTGYANQERIDAALKEGAADCLMKPFTMADLKAMLEKKLKNRIER